MMLYKEEAYKIIGAAMAVHNELGPGFLEAVYQEALAIEFSERGIPFEQEVFHPIFYHGIQLKRKFRSDFTCYDKIITETKAQSFLTNIDKAQVLNYLKITNYRLGLLINFGAGALEYERIVL